MGVKSTLKVTNVGGVDVYIDTAYDNVKKVADNLEALLALQSTITNLAGIYLGEFASNPTQRGDTTPLQDGDHYKNTGDNLFYVFIDSGWVFHSVFYTQSEFDAAIASSPFYTWFAYADDNVGTGITLDPTGKVYLGIATNQTASTPSIGDPGVFTWGLMTGLAGATSYLHLAYADSANGVTNFNYVDGKYIGKYSDFSVADSADPLDYTWSVQRGDDGVTPAKGIDYFDGDAGQFHSFIFRNAVSAPATPTGGSFDGTTETYPTNWTDDPVVPSLDTEKTWVSKRIYKEDGGVWAQVAWSLPSLWYQKGDKPVYGTDYTTADGAFVTFIFRNALTLPSPPIGGSYDGVTEVVPVGWFDNPTATTGDNLTWVSKRVYVHDGVSWAAGAWGEVVKFYEKGDNGVTPVKGTDYFDGTDGSFVSFIYRNDSVVIQVATPIGGAFNGTTETTPTGWTDDPAPQVGEDGTWMSKGIWRNNGTSWIQPTWSTPTIFKDPDWTERVTTIETEMDTGTGRMAVYATTTWVDGFGYQTSSQVNTLISTFDTTYSISATLTEMVAEGTIVKASSAQLWVDGADAYIEGIVTSFNAEPDSVNDQLNTASTRIDAIDGIILSQVSSLNTLRLAGEDAELSSVLSEYAIFAMKNGIALGDTKFAYADASISAIASESQSSAESITTLFANFNSASSSIDTLNQAIVTQYQATATTESTLRVEMANGDATSVATAQEYTRVSVGYCIDGSGNITAEADAVACVNGGDSWVEGPLAEFIRKLSIDKAGNAASIEDIRQVFERSDGNLVARGGMITDVNGNIAGHISTNDGTTSTFDVVTELFRVGVYDTDDTTFVPLLTLDRVGKIMNLKANLVLGDGYPVNGQADIQALDGADGAQGIPGPTGPNGDTSYLHIAYATNASGTTGFDVTDSVGKTYIGQYTDFILADSTNPALYAWSLIKGDVGADGSNGTNGARGAGRFTAGTLPSPYTWVDGHSASDAAANAATGGTPVVNDVVTLYRAGVPATQFTKSYSGSAWATFALQVHGNALVDGTLFVDQLVGEQAAADILSVSSQDIGATEVTLFGVNYSNQSIGYNVVLNWIYFGGIEVPNGVIQYDAPGGYVEVRVLLNGSQYGSTWVTYTHKYTITSHLFVIPIPASTSGNITIKAKFIQDTAGYAYLLFPTQTIVAQLLKESTLLTVIP